MCCIFLLSLCLIRHCTSTFAFICLFLFRLHSSRLIGLLPLWFLQVAHSEGSPCGLDMQCYRGQCLRSSLLPHNYTAVEGTWSWVHTSFGPCDVKMNCGPGKRPVRRFSLCLSLLIFAFNAYLLGLMCFRVNNFAKFTVATTWTAPAPQKAAASVCNIRGLLKWMIVLLISLVHLSALSIAWN